MQRKKGLAHGDLNFGLTPGNHLSVATDKPNRDRRAQIFSFPTTEDQTLGHVVRITLDQRLLDEEVNVIGR